MILNTIKKYVLRFLDWVVRDEKSEENDEPRMTFSSFSSGGMQVKGFMRDFKLISQIDPKHFSNGADRPSSITLESRDFNTSTDEGDIESDEEVIESDSAIVSSKRIPMRFNYRNDDGKDVKKTVVLESQTGLLSPKQVFDELQTVPTPADFKNLDAKIETYTKIYDVIRVDSSHGNRETIGDILQRLKNRKLYDTDTSYSVFFSNFKNTTDSAINILLDKYEHLRIGPADDFIPEMPADALNSMLEYTDMVVKMCNVKPVFYLIAKSTDFRKVGEARGKRDPILLVQSPIGFFWQIIGAWDEQDMLLVNEL